jgi:hypothetical protein
MHLRRYTKVPILLPTPFRSWEALNVFKAAVVHHNLIVDWEEIG